MAIMTERPALAQPFYSKKTQRGKHVYSLEFVGVLYLKSCLRPPRISEPSVFKLPFNAENAEIRRGRRENS